MTRDQVTAVLDRVRRWPLEQQAELALLAEHIEALHGQHAPEDATTRGAIAEGLSQARHGEFATAEEVEAAYARFRS